jgi:hypothetical protein
MYKVTFSHASMPLITFNSDKWESTDEYIDVANEIIIFMKEHNYEAVLIQNTSFYFGDMQVHPLIMINNDDFGGFKGALDLHIKDVILELLPDNYLED